MDTFKYRKLNGDWVELASKEYVDSLPSVWEPGTGTNSVQTVGTGATAVGADSVAEGLNTIANSAYSHAEGYASKTVIDADDTETHGQASHAEGTGTTAKGASSHAEGVGTLTLGRGSHAEGNSTTTGGNASHAEGNWTITNNLAEHAEGTFNLSNMASSTFGNAGNTLHSVGIGHATGELEDDRKNAFEIMQNGDAYFLGIGDYDGTNPSDADTLQEVVNSKIEDAPSDDKQYARQNGAWAEVTSGNVIPIQDTEPDTDLWVDTSEGILVDSTHVFGAVWDVTLLSSGWTADGANYTQTVSATGLDHHFVLLGWIDNPTTAQAEAYGDFIEVKSLADDTVTVITSVVPAIDIPIKVKYHESVEQKQFEDFALEEDLEALDAAKYQKPSSGIPSSDMTSAVQTSLGKADNAVLYNTSAQGLSDAQKGNARTNIAALESKWIEYMHNSVLRCKDITSYVTDGTLWNRISGNGYPTPYWDIFAGDYIRMSRPISAYERTGQYQATGSQYVTVASCGGLWGAGDSNAITYPHLVMVPGQGEGGTQHFGRSRMNSSNTTVGGYAGSEMHTATIGAVTSSGATGSQATINQQLYAEFGSHLKTVRALLANSINASGYNRFGTNGGCSNNWAWTDVQAVLMSEVELYGSEVWSSSGYDTGEAKNQLALFRLSTQALNNRTAWYWLRGVASASDFCNSISNGYAAYYSASNADSYVRPRFVLA